VLVIDQLRPIGLLLAVSGERELGRGIEKMMNNGWTVQNQDSRKAMYSLATGIFTRKQIHTVTFVKP
jgi:hypothetical protein